MSIFPTKQRANEQQLEGYQTFDCFELRRDTLQRYCPFAPALTQLVPYQIVSWLRGVFSGVQGINERNFEAQQSS